MLLREAYVGSTLMQRQLQQQQQQRGAIVPAPASQRQQQRQQRTPSLSHVAAAAAAAATSTSSDCSCSYSASSSSSASSSRSSSSWGTTNTTRARHHQPRRRSTRSAAAAASDSGSSGGSGSSVAASAAAAAAAAVTALANAPSSSSGLSGEALAFKVRADVPILDQQVNGRPLVYLDSAATSQKPLPVIVAMDEYWRGYNSNVHRGVHHLSARATAAYEAARAKVAAFVNAGSDRDIVFTRNASEGINLVANSWGLSNLRAGDEIVLSVAEHHSNLVPWQLVAQKTGAVLKHVRLTPDTQELDVAHLRELVTPRTRLISLVHVSNMLGATLDVGAVVEAARGVGARVLLDACQSVPNMPVDVQALGVDWIVSSGHKMMAPTGIGFLWGRPELLEAMPPWMGGGEMIQDVYLDHSTYAAPPARFEAGTPSIAEAIGLGAACDYLSELGMAHVHAWEQEIGGYLYERLSEVDGVTIYGPPPTVARGRAALASFNVGGLHATDVSTLLDAAGVAVRSGHHCTQPLHRYLGISASARASCYAYTTRADVDAFIDALREAVDFFGSVGLE